MVANAGITEISTLSDGKSSTTSSFTIDPFSVPIETFQRVQQVNCIGVLLCYRAAAVAMIKIGTAKGGKLIGACSQAGKQGAELMGAYCVSKFGVRAITQTAGKYSRARGIGFQ